MTGPRAMVLDPLPLLAIATLTFTLLSAIGLVPRIPYASETLGIIAVTLAPGIVAEPLLHGGRWMFIERLGLAAALSFATAGLLGVGLQLAGLPVSPTNVLSLLLLVVALAYLLRLRSRRVTVRTSITVGPEIAVGAGSLALLAGGLAVILVLGPSPDSPPLEVMIVDDAGQLAAMPMDLAGQRTTLNVLVRSASAGLTSVTVTIGGDAVRGWSTSAVLGGREWTNIDVPVEATATGRALAYLTVATDAVELTLPAAFDSTP